MSWLRLEDNMLDHPKWRRAIREGGDGALTVWFRLVSWCSRHLTDGAIPADMLQQLTEVGRARDRRKVLDGLVSGGLLVIDGSGSGRIVDYLERNPGRDQVLAARERKSSLQRKRRDRPPDAGLQSETAQLEVFPQSQSQSQSQSHERAALSARAPEPPGRIVSLPSEEPSRDYLEAAVMAGVSTDQARSTWAHYWGAGLPDRGVERLTPWLVKRAKERSNQLAKASRGRGSRPHSQPDAGVDPWQKANIL